MLIKPSWEIFKAKFSENPQDNFEWFCYLLFSKEYNQPYGTHRYKNQSGIETDPITVGNEVIGWQSKFYEDSLSSHKEDLLGTLTKTKRDNPNITKIILYTNSEWGQGQGTKEPKAKIETEEKANELNIELIWRTRSYFESPFVCQEQRDISRYFFELNTKWELTNNGFKDTLRYCYLKNFKTISLLDEKKKRVSDIFVNLAIIKEQKEEQKEQFINKGTFEEIYKPKELINISKKSLIYGKAGIGKTTLCKYIAYMWAKGELYTEFEYVIYIPLRKWNNTQLKEIIRSHYYSQYNEEINLDIKENSHKILFLFDGYDELKSEKRDGFHDAIRDNNLTYYIITTRPYGYQKSDFIVDEYLETIGFTDEDVEEYIYNFFEEENDEAYEKGQSLERYIAYNLKIKYISSIPIMLGMICSLWEKKEFTENMTMPELYGQVVNNLLENHSQDKNVYEWENRENIKNLLGKIAFEGLINKTIVFDGKFIQDTIGKENLNFFKESIVNSGFLKSDRKDKSLLGNNFEFYHLTFQEYFSALYVQGLPKEEQSKKIQESKFHPHMQMFFAFLGGIIDDKEFLLDEIKNEPKDIIGYYELLLLSDCLSEMKDYNNQVFLDEINEKMIEWLYRLINFSNMDINGKTELYTTIFERIKNNQYFHTQNVLDKLMILINQPWWDSYYSHIAICFHRMIKSGFSFEEQIKPFLDKERLLDFEKIIKYGENNNSYSRPLYKTYSFSCHSYKDKEEYEKDKKYQYSLTTSQVKEETSIQIEIINDEELKKALFSILNLSLPSHSNYPHKNAIEALWKFFEISDNDVVNIALKFIVQSRDQSILGASERLLTSFKRDDDEFRNILLKAIKDEELDDFPKEMEYMIANGQRFRRSDKIRNTIAQKLFKIEKYPPDYIEELVLIIEKGYVTFSNNIITESVLKNSMTIDIFERLFDYELHGIVDEDRKSFIRKIFDEDIFSVTYNSHINSNRNLNFLQGIKLEVLFQAYDKGYDVSTIILSNLIFSNKPLYINKKKQLCTIENGKEISTQREVDEATLNEIKMLLLKGKV